MKKYIILLFCLSSFIPTVFAGKLNVVTANQDLADFVMNIGKDKVNVIALSGGERDPHFVEPMPSMVIKVRNADMVVKIGMDLDMWLQSLIDASRNKKVMYGNPGYVDASAGIVRLEVPQGKVDASMGHIHVFGNPHYLIGPQNVPAVIKNITGGLIRVSPENSDYFKKNSEEYLAKFNTGYEDWKSKMEKFKGVKIVTYHKSWEYFTDCFGLVLEGNLEPKPGIPPSPAHLNSLIAAMKEENVRLIIQETFYSKKTGKMVAGETGAKFIVLPISTGAMGTKDYISFIDYIVNEISKTLE